MSEPESNILSYAPARRFRRKIRKIDVAVVLVFLIAVIAFINWGSIQQFYIAARTQLAERRCMQHELPDGAIAYTDDDSVSALMPQQSYQRTGAGRATMYQPAALTTMWAWESKGYPGPARKQRGAVIYLHERTAATGVKHLVWITVEPRFSSPDASRDLTFSSTTKLKGAFTSRAYGAIVWKHRFVFSGSSSDRLTLYYGKSDPTDAARFTINYSFNGKLGTLDGQLLNNGYVTLAPRDGEGRIWFPDTPMRQWIPGSR
jgi:hypothetical protein